MKVFKHDSKEDSIMKPHTIPRPQQLTRTRHTCLTMYLSSSSHLTYMITSHIAIIIADTRDILSSNTQFRITFPWMSLKHLFTCLLEAESK